MEPGAERRVTVEESIDGKVLPSLYVKCNNLLSFYKITTILIQKNTCSILFMGTYFQGFTSP